MADTSARDSGECRKTPQGAAPISRRRPSMDPDERARAIHDAVVSLFVDGGRWTPGCDRRPGAR